MSRALNGRDETPCILIVSAATVERQQLTERVVVGDVGGPTVRGSYRRVKGLVRIGEPLRPGVVRVAPRLLLKYNIRAVRALGSAWSDLAGLDEVVEGGAGDVEYLGDGGLGCSQGPLGPAEQFPLGFGSGESFLGPF